MKWVLRILIGLVVVVSGAAGGGYYWLRGSLPVLDGTVRVAGPTATVEVLRDGNGVPHILAASAADAYFGLGFVHAQDRLWQMELTRRAGAGRTAEIFGARALATDKYMRTLGLHIAAQRSLAHFPPETLALLDAYTAGVNAIIESGMTPLAPEFVFFQHRPEPWTPADSVLAVKMMALQLSGNAHGELLRSKLLESLTPAQVAALWPPYPGEREAAMAPATPVAPEVIEAALDVVPPGPPAGVGSNNWVVGGELSETGKPLLANDPHLGLTAPAAWYLAHLHAPGLNVAGATLPGVPVMVVGRNATLAWGVTNTGSDVQDLFVERLDPQDPERYQTPDGPARFAYRDEVLKVKGGEAVRLRVRATRHGPVISDVSPRHGESLTEGEVLALAWTALADDDTTLHAGFGLTTAKDWNGAVTALRDFLAPQQNFVAADANGAIGMIAPGRVPVRRAGDGWLPAAGWTGESDWIGFVPYDALPRQDDPASRRIVTANQKIVPDDYPYFLTRDWAAPYRARRIEALLAGVARHSVAGFKAIQTDVTSLMAREFLPLLMAPETLGRATAVRARLKGWDGAMRRDGVEPLIFHAWYRALTRRVYGDELGADFPRAWSRRPVFMRRALTESVQWCDDIATARTENCAVQITAALDSAIAWLDDKYGDDPDDWLWGRAHPAHSRHRVFSNVAVAGWLFDIKLAHGGGPYTVMQANTVIGDEAAPFAETHGASLRAIFDLADGDATQVMISTGQSGNRLSPHYGDLAEPWRDGRYIALPLSEAGARAIAVHRLVLTP